MSFQKCPVCSGKGTLRNEEIDSRGTLNPIIECPTCEGTGIISEFTGLPPNKRKEKRFPPTDWEQFKKFPKPPKTKKYHWERGNFYPYGRFGPIIVGLRSDSEWPPIIGLHIIDNII